MDDRIWMSLNWLVCGMCLMQTAVMVRDGQSPWISALFALANGVCAARTLVFGSVR
jgi:hypothetical protein